MHEIFHLTPALKNNLVTVQYLDISDSQVVHTYNLSTGEAQAGGPEVQV